MGIRPTERQQELVAMVAEIGPQLAERARTYDAEASFPYENWDDLRSLGFLGLCVPEHHGGLGADYSTYALVSEEIGSHCGATALTFNMHSATALFCGQVADDLELTAEERETHERRRTGLFRRMVDEGVVCSQPFSEGHAPGATAGVLTRAVPTDDGFLVSGRKIFASLSSAADLQNITCTVEGEDRIRFLGVPVDADGVSFEGEWDPMGMRGTVSPTLVMDEVFVPADNEFLPPGAFDQAAARWPHMYMTLSFTFLGLSRAAVDFTRLYLRGELPGTSGGSRRDNPQKQAGWAKMNLLYEGSRQLLHTAVSEAGVDPSPDEVRRAWAATVTTMEAAPEIASLAIRVCGGRSILRPLALERLYRDARCGATMLPWSVEVCLDRLGRAGLYDDEEAPA